MRSLFDRGRRAETAYAELEVAQRVVAAAKEHLESWVAACESGLPHDALDRAHHTHEALRQGVEALNSVMDLLQGPAERLVPDTSTSSSRLWLVPSA